MGILSKGSILAADDIKIKYVDVPEWGGKVGLRVISGTARDKFEACYTEKDMVNFRVKFLAASLCGEDGELLFSDADIEALGKKSNIVINRLFNEAFAHSAFTGEAIDELGKD